ncbi:MAG: hypothetical protein ACI9DH_001035 [Halioglobus sp.]|jgi:hypothetical protein
MVISGSVALPVPLDGSPLLMGLPRTVKYEVVAREPLAPITVYGECVSSDDIP